MLGGPFEKIKKNLKSDSNPGPSKMGKVQQKYQIYEKRDLRGQKKRFPMTERVGADTDLKKVGKFHI